MRALLSKEQERALEEKKKVKVKILGLFLLFILAVSSIGYAFISNDNPSTTTGDLTEGQIIQQNGRWFAKVGGQTINFAKSLEETANITDTSSVGINEYYNQNIYYVDNDNVLISELSQNLAYFSRIQQACYGTCNLNIPEKDCTEKMIVWNKTSSENKIYQVDNCVFIEGDIRAVDAFLYRIFGLK